MERPFITKAFLLLLLAAIIYACYLVFKPFLVDMLAAAILVSIFYTPYEWLTRKLGNRRRLAALTMCLLVALLVIIPLTNILVYTAQRSVVAYGNISEYLSGGKYDEIINNPILKNAYEFVFKNESIKNVIIEVAKKINDWFVSGATVAIKSTTNFFISLVLIIFTMFFFFADGPMMVERLMRWTPLPNEYDRAIFKKFRDVSFSTMISTFVTAAAPGAVGAIAFWIVGLPVFFTGVAMGLLSLLPYIGSGIVWFPASIYLLIIGKVWQGIFLLAWGFGVVSMVDNLIRAYLIKGKAHVHPIFIIFSILGGISLFGFWGVVFGPLLISLAVTVLHIYEMEYGKTLDK
jgi:predicted PurR-regulated permease PerM